MTMQSSTAGSSLLTFILASIAVIALAYVASRLLGNWQSVQTKGRRLRVLEGVPIGKDRSIYLVAVGKEVLVLGSSPSGVNLVHKVEDESLLPDLLSDSAETGRPQDSSGLEENIRGHLDRMRSLLVRAGGGTNG